VKDLDFDELDRAVNSLIAKTPNGVSGGNTNNTSVPIVPDITPVPVIEPVPTPPMQLPVGGGLPIVPIIAPTPVVERPNTGRFMDVVHPSSNMRTPFTGYEQPPVQAVTPPTSPLPPMGPVPPVELVTSPITPMAPPDPIITEKPSIIDKWPDPIDFKGNNVTKDPSQVDKDDDADIDSISNDIANTLNQTSSDSPDSPFLSGAKVEKRPLGAFSSDQTTNNGSTFQPTPLLAPKIPATDSPSVSDSASIAAENPDENTPLPAELQNDLLSIESDSTTQPETPIVSTNITDVPVATTATVNQPTVTASTASNTTISTPVTTSISPQYKEQPSTGEQKNGAIYDTKTYHKAMVRPAKRKSGWMWVIWIVIFLIVGAGTGAAVYFFVLPRL
jgi:hypothetical protein